MERKALSVLDSDMHPLCTMWRPELEEVCAVVNADVVLCPQSLYCKWWVVYPECHDRGDSASIRCPGPNSLQQSGANSVFHTTGNALSFLAEVWHEPGVVSEVSIGSFYCLTTWMVKSASFHWHLKLSLLNLLRLLLSNNWFNILLHVMQKELYQLGAGNICISH